MRKLLAFVLSFILFRPALFAQADDEIQVYASPTIQPKWTIFELHSNYTFRGTRMLADPASARWQNETLEITHGVRKNFELGFYTFSGISPQGDFQYLGNRIRPRVTAPQEWNWPVGASLSCEIGFSRPHKDSAFLWGGELRPIVDKTWGNFYLSFNPNIEFALTGSEKGAGLTPQVKSVYTLGKKYGLGIEYYGALGSFRRLLPYGMQEHLLGPAVDLYLHPDWEINAGFLFGLTDNSNQRIFKLLLGRRIGK
ncbi:hypothetical protein [Flavisolibacter nicotianae]|uniref:hypothetical protein n=1 Tax=Flavisolibacter nicotianae TaxID=2364882 RepID=UPI000EAB695A|nr:hypothetical protein [Flavisolibacter nicotianae]